MKQHTPLFHRDPGLFLPLCLPLRLSNPEQRHTALEAINQSTINHIQHTKELGASGALLSILNAEGKIGTVADYESYSRTYDQRSSMHWPIPG